MKVGDLVRIKGIEAYLGLFVVRKDYNDALLIRKKTMISASIHWR